MQAKNRFVTHAVIFFLIALLSFQAKFIEGIFRFRISSYNTYLSTDNVLNSFSPVSSRQCIEECAEVPECVTINYNRRFKLCEMYSNSLDVATTRPTPEACVLIEKQCMCNKNQVHGPCTSQSTCTGGNCGRNFCPLLRLANGTLLGNINSEGSRVQYSCNKYLKESAGKTFSICQQNNSWTHVPECVKYFEYMGCFLDDSYRILDGEQNLTPQMTTEYCVNYCFGLGRNYAMTEFHYQCFCGDVLRHFNQRPEQECNTPCSGDNSERCGGSWRASLYTRI